ncbi:MAG: hypothetical protein Kow0090_04690 [Myxococcota bacterium]
MGNSKSIKSAASLTGLDETQREILSALARLNTPAGNKELATATGLATAKLASAIKTLKSRGLVDSPVRCKYCITKDGVSELGK